MVFEFKGQKVYYSSSKLGLICINHFFFVGTVFMGSEQGKKTPDLRLQTCRKLPRENEMKDRYSCWYGKQSYWKLKHFTITELCKFFQERCMTNLLILLFQKPMVIVLILSVSKHCIKWISLASTVELFIISGGWLLATSYAFTKVLHWYCIMFHVYWKKSIFWLSKNSWFSL